MIAELDVVVDGVHPFERAGLGKAPFRFISFEVKVCSGMPGLDGFTIVGYAGQPAGSCHYCGQGIKYCCNIKSADGKRFTVGMDCVLQLNKESNRAIVDAVKKEKAKIDAANRAASKAKRDAKSNARIDAAAAAFPTVREAMAAKPHPYSSEYGDRTLADYCEWCLKNAGMQGKLRAAYLIESAVIQAANT